MQAEGADFSGWGSKQGSKVKTWKKRFFVLRGRELVYYSGSEEKGRLTVLGADFAPDLKNGLLVRGEKARKTQTLKMKTATADESKAWLQRLRAAVVSADSVDDHRSMSFRTRSASNSALGSNNSRLSSSSSNLSNSSHLSNSSAFMGSSLPSVPEQAQHALQMPRATAVSAPVEPSFRHRANTSSNEKRGWLLKEGSKVKSWKKRFFVLRGNVLTYYADQQSSPKLGSVVVRSVETNFTTPFTLDVHADGGRVLRIAADSLDDIEGWDLAITDAIARGHGDSGADIARRASDSRSSESAAKLAMAASSVSTTSTAFSDGAFEQPGKVQFRHQQSSLVGESSRQQKVEQQQQLAAAEVNNVTCEGWLLKQGRRSAKWKRRYFTLSNASLEYRHDPNDFPNEEEMIVDVVFETRTDAAVAHVELDSGRTITIAAESRNEFKRWAKALSELTDKPCKPGSDMLASSSSIKSFRPTAAPKEEKEEVPVVPVGPPAQPEIKYGWLLKQGSLIRSWKRRYFVLEGDSLQYFEHIDKPARGGGAVARVVRDPAVVGDNCLDVHLANGRILKVASEDAAELGSWYDALLNASRLLPTTTSVRTTATHEARSFEASDNNVGNDNGAGSATSSPVVDVAARRLTKKLGQEGWLLKKGQNFKTWKMRYFVLERSRLLYYASDGDAGRGEVLGSGVVFEVAVGDSRPFCIDVRFQNGRLLQVVAPDEEQFALWLDALQNSSNLTESFLSQHEDSQRGGDANTFDDEFDLDFADDGTADDELDWSSNQIDENDRDTKSGFATWSAAMENKPELERSGSWGSSEDDNNAGGERGSAATKNGASSPPQNPASVQRAVVAGWLNKEGGTIKTWKRRYFSLHGTTLRYFKSESGSMLRALTIARVSESLALPLALEVETTADRTLVLTAESKEEYAKWLAGLQSALSMAATGDARVAAPTAGTIDITVRTPIHASDNSAAVSSRVSSSGAPAKSSPPSSPAANAALDLGRASTVNAEGKTVTAHSGWLEKEGDRFKTWKRRFFTYKRGALLYYREVGGVALGHGIVTSVRVDESKALTLSLQLENARELRVTAESQDDMDTWLRVLSSDCPAVWPSPAETRDSTAASQVPGGGRGEAREHAANRLDPNDYLANDTISNESFLRIQDEQHRQHTESNPESFAVASHRSFKGDLNFGGDDEEKEEETRTQKQALVAAESGEDLAYYRTLLVEGELERERREAEKAASGGVHNVSGCAPCCVVM